MENKREKEDKGERKKWKKKDREEKTEQKKKKEKRRGKSRQKEKQRKKGRENAEIKRGKKEKRQKEMSEYKPLSNLDWLVYILQPSIYEQSWMVFLLTSNNHFLYHQGRAKKRHENKFDDTSNFISSYQL